MSHYKIITICHEVTVRVQDFRIVTYRDSVASPNSSQLQEPRKTWVMVAMAEMVNRTDVALDAGVDTTGIPGQWAGLTRLMISIPRFDLY